MIDYKTINENINNTIEIEKSKFTCYLYKVETLEAIKETIKEVKKYHPKANHVCYAYIINNGLIYKSTDDNEPNGTAGLPILDTLRKNNYNNIIAIVVRYFGGILLGKGGLVRAYTNATLEALKIASTIVEGYRQSYTLIFDYSLYNSLNHFLTTKEIRITNTLFNEQIELTIILLENFDMNKIISFCLGKVKIINNGEIKIII